LCELNVIDQVQNVARTTVVIKTRGAGRAVQLHGWVYGLRDGLITDLGIAVDR
jgi:carbonic anhydrase